MSVRQLRRSFATPFIVTLAGSAAVAACGPKPLPTHSNPPGPHTNPPAPDTGSNQPTTGEPTAGEHAGHEHAGHEHAGHEHDGPPPATPTTGDATPAPPIHKNPPPPQPPVKEPAKYEQRWTVMKFKGNPDCQAMIDVQCPKPEPGKAVPTCNPPPPIKYACPDGFKDGDTLKIVLRVGATDCFVDRGPIKCPDGAKCNPPPPRKVACPER